MSEDKMHWIRSSDFLFLVETMFLCMEVQGFISKTISGKYNYSGHEDLQVKVGEYDISQTNEVMGTPSKKSLKLLLALSNLNQHVKWVYSIQYGDETGHIRQPLTFVNLYLQAKKYQGIFNLFWEYNWFKNSAV